MIGRCDELLSRAGVDKIYLVFDGVRVPLKSGTNTEREAKRQENLREARRLMRLGRSKEAGERYKACVKGNDTMARVVAAEVEKRWGEDPAGTDASVRVKCVWSPYEADSQLAKLCIDGWAHAVVTEDSDVLVYSAVTRRPFPIIYKLDRKDGSCDVVTMDWLVNPAFLAASSGGGVSSRRRRRRERNRDLDYVYNDNGSTENDSQGVEAQANRHPCEVEYDDMVFAPVRRALPSPAAASSGAKSGRGKRKGSGGGKSEGNAGGGALLSYLRSFAHREAMDPGAGVRLFVQACVLSGCDYVPNRLSKVGPVTAFKLVKEASHRDPSIVFERVLKSLPTGSKLIAETGDNNGLGDGDEGNDNEENYDEFLSSPATARDAKDQYEELLSKSEAVFYYHLAKQLDTGNVGPLVPHKSNETEREEKGSNLEVDENSRPCIGRFQPGLAFVGSAAEALKKNTEPLPALAISQERHSHRPTVSQNNNNDGWMSTNRHNSNDGGSVHNTYRKSSCHRWPTKQPAAAPKETSLQRYFKGATSMRPLGNKINSLNAGMVKPISGNANKIGKSKGSAHHGGSSADVGKNALNKSVASATTNSSNTQLRTKTNPFAAFSHAASKETELPKEKSPIPTSGDHATDKALMKSPLLSPVKFDYGGFTPPPGSISGMNTKLKSHVDANATSNTAVGRSSRHFSKRCSDNDSLEILEDEEEGEKQTKQLATSTVVEYSGNDTLFDYGIVPESPPIKAPADPNTGMLSKYINHTKVSDSRRVSTSPSERKSNTLEDVIDLSDDTADDSAGDVAGKSTVNENRPILDQPFASKMKSSVNKQPFKSPYYPTTATGIKKTTSKTSSSALLAGFARQQKVGSSLSSSSGNGAKKRKSRFFLTKATEGSCSLKMANYVLGKRSKGTPSLRDFYGPSNKDR